MNQTIETRFKSLEAAVSTMQKQLEEKDSQLEKAERRLQDLLDIEAIKRLQCAYGYYLEHWMADEVVDLFADLPETSASFSEGTYLRLEGVRRYFNRMKNPPPTFLHQVMQVNPVITLGGDGKTAKGRWYGYGTVCAKPVNDAIDPGYISVIYEMEYIKLDGVWKILKLDFQRHYFYKQPRPDAEKEATRSTIEMNMSPNIWREYDTQYPSGFIYPFHFKHPVTGRETSEGAYNAGLTLKPCKYRPV